MSAAAIAPLSFPPPKTDPFLKLTKADMKLFGRTCAAFLSAALRYRAKKFGARFYLTYEWMMEQIRCGRTSVYNSLKKLIAAGKATVESDGRGVWINWLEVFCLEHQKFTNGTADINSSSRARQAAEVGQKLQEQDYSQVVEENLPRGPEQQFRADQHDPAPTAKGQGINPVREAVEIWQMGEDQAKKFTLDALRIACSRMAKRFDRAQQRGQPIENTGGYLRKLALCIPGSVKPLVFGKRHEGLASSKSLIRGLFDGEDDYNNWQRQFEGER